MNPDKILIGKYLPYDTVVHRIDARIKFLMLIMLIVALFFNGGFEPYLFITAFMVLAVIVSKLPLRQIVAPLYSLVIMFLFILIVTVFVSAPPQGSTNLQYYQRWFNIGSLVVYNQALLRTIYIVWRVYLMILITTVFTATTKPLNITLAIEDLLKPLKYIRFPVHELAMIIAIALRFIPTILAEASKIISAQASRGVDLKNGRFREKVKSLSSLVVPLFVSAFQKADDLANAMDARGYNPKAKRTRYRKLKVRFVDVLWLILIMAVLTFAILYSNSAIDNIFHWHFFGNYGFPVFN